MRIVLAGPVAATLDQVEDWRRRTQPAGPDAVREAMMAWGFVAEAETDEPIDPYAIAYETEELGEQGVYLFVPTAKDCSFFLHGYRRGTPLLYNDQPVEVPEPQPLPAELVERYLPPVMHEFPAHVQPPPLRPVYRCVKCGGDQPRFSELRGPGGAVTAYLDWDTEAFTVVTCENCSYAELYGESVSEMKRRFTPTLRAD